MKSTSSGTIRIWAPFSSFEFHWRKNGVKRCKWSWRMLLCRNRINQMIPESRYPQVSPWKSPCQESRQGSHRENKVETRNSLWYLKKTNRKKKNILRLREEQNSRNSWICTSKLQRYLDHWLRHQDVQSRSYTAQPKTKLYHLKSLHFQRKFLFL